VEEVITHALGLPTGQVFAELQPEPAAAASIAQVHRAGLRCDDGPDPQVAVKVQRPGIRATVEQDLDILLRLAVRLERQARWARAVGAVGLARGFAASMREELDFRVEARNMAAVAAAWPSQQRAAGSSVSVVLPAVYEQLCTQHVLVIEWLDGVSLRAAGQLIDDRGLDRAELTRALLRSMVYQITEGGVFHADPHPGNVLLLTDGRMALLDFGSVGRLDAQQRSALQNLLLALGRGDPAALRDVPRCRIWHRRRVAARRGRRPQDQPQRQPLPADRLQPAHRRRDPGPASAVYDLQEPVKRGTPHRFRG
jgi:ubiquinone biosynthesis protein